jgi:hypothetical protein
MEAVNCVDEVLKRIARAAPVMMLGVEVRASLRRSPNWPAGHRSTSFMGHGLLSAQDSPLIGAYPARPAIPPSRAWSRLRLPACSA